MTWFYMDVRASHPLSWNFWTCTRPETRWPPAGAARLGPLTDQIDFQGEMNNCQVSQQLP